MYDTNLKCDLKDTGFKYLDRVIHSFVGGSELHGAKLHGTDDHDVMGIYIEPPIDMLGLEQTPHLVWSTSKSGERNCPHDVDVTFYGLQKWARLAVKGNPSILNFMFAPRNPSLEYPQSYAWKELMDEKEFFLARSHWKQFSGYAGAQLARMVGERNRKTNRPELVEAYGYDTKFAMHTIRILSEGLELLQTGNISFPSCEVDLLREIRRGERSQDWVIDECKRRMEALETFGKNTSVHLPMANEIDRQHVSYLIERTYREYWIRKGDR
jgi:predicted nucleotidyltransferase